jgi:hypothetical protein
MKGVWQNRECRHLCIRHLATGWVGIGVELALHSQSGLGCGRRDQLKDDGVALQWFATPVLTDPGKEAMLDFVPFARTRRQMADHDRQASLIGKLLEFPFPQAHARAIAPSPIALMSNRLACGYCSLPTSFHHRRMRISRQTQRYRGLSRH